MSHMSLNAATYCQTRHSQWPTRIKSVAFCGQWRSTNVVKKYASLTLSVLMLCSFTMSVISCKAKQTTTVETSQLTGSSILDESSLIIRSGHFTITPVTQPTGSVSRKMPPNAFRIEFKDTQTVAHQQHTKMNLAKNDTTRSDLSAGAARSSRDYKPDVIIISFILFVVAVATLFSVSHLRS